MAPLTSARDALRILAIPTLFVLSSACAGQPPPASLPPASKASVASSPFAADGELADAAAAPVDGDTPTAVPRSAQLAFRSVALPDVPAPASLDYIAYEPSADRVWIPVGNTGSVHVYDIASGTFKTVTGFKTAQRVRNGKMRTFGVSAVAIGDGVAYIGNRATSEVCPVDTRTLKSGACVSLPSPSDGVAWVSSVKEVWVTTPLDRSITVLDASTPNALKVKATIPFDGAPEGYASDPSRGLFFTNLEDKNKTAVVDIQTHAIKATWILDCADEPRGIAEDSERGFVFVACTDRVVVLDGAHGGAKLGTLDTGAGVDNIDWVQSQRLLYAAAGKAGLLTVARIDDVGQPVVMAKGTSSEGARNAVADARGNAYVADSVNARLLVFPHSP